MARIRSVHPGICSSEDMAALPAEVERTFVRLWTHCDDEGRCRDNLRLIKAAIYPLHDDMTVDILNDHIDELVDGGQMVAYEIDHKAYLEVVAWGDYQKPQRPTVSKIPAPKEGSIRSRNTARGDVREASRTEGRGGEGNRSTRDRAAQPLELVTETRSSAPADGAEFDGWWEQYPRKVDKAKARAAYLKARRRVPQAALTTALEQQKLVWDRERRPADKVPHATTWLNGERWDDEDLTEDGGDARADLNGWVER